LKKGKRLFRSNICRRSSTPLNFMEETTLKSGSISEESELISLDGGSVSTVSPNNGKDSKNVKKRKTKEDEELVLNGSMDEPSSPSMKKKKGPPKSPRGLNCSRKVKDGSKGKLCWGCMMGKGCIFKSLTHEQWAKWLPTFEDLSRKRTWDFEVLGETRRACMRKQEQFFHEWCKENLDKPLDMSGISEDGQIVQAQDDLALIQEDGNSHVDGETPKVHRTKRREPHPPVPHPPLDERVKNILTSIGLDRYISVFTNEEVDFESLCLMTENHLKNVGIPQGPRLKILHRLSLNDLMTAAEAVAVPE